VIPTLPDMLSFNTSHLTDHAGHWTDAADRRRDVWGAVREDADTLAYTADGMHQAVSAHAATAFGEADTFDAAAQTARNGASILEGHQKTILNTVNKAEQQGFSVNDNWAVTDTRSRTALEQAARQPAALDYQTQIVSQLTDFMVQQYETSAELGGHATMLDSQQCNDAMQREHDNQQSNVLRNMLWAAIAGGVAAGPWAALTAAGVAGIGSEIEVATDSHPAPPECR
jgi:hypothetical protein